MMRKFPVLDADGLKKRNGMEVVLYKNHLEYSMNIPIARGVLSVDSSGCRLHTDLRDYPLSGKAEVQPNYLAYNVLEFPSLEDARHPGKKRAFAVQF